MSFYEVCVRTDRTKAITWNSTYRWFDNAEAEHDITASTPLEAAERYVRECCVELGEAFDEHGGSIEPSTESACSAKLEVWVRECNYDDYSMPAWKRYVVSISAEVEYRIDGAVEG